MAWSDFNRTTAGFQNVNGSTTFSNFNSANPNSTLYVQSGIQTITSALHLSAGILYGGGRITLASNSNHTGLINDFSPGYTGTLNGTVTVQRYIAGSRGYRYLSNPIQASAGLTVLNFGPSISGANGIVYDPYNPPGPTGYPTCWVYNENDANAIESQNPQWGWVSATNASNALQTMRGYAVIINSAQTLAYTGPPNTGTINFPIGYTSSGRVTADGFNLLGNPYPSPISWTSFRAIGSNATQISNVVKRFSSNSQYTGQYADWNGTVGTNGATDNIALGQGFFVKALPGATSVQIQNGARINAPATGFFEETTNNQTDNLLRLKISGEKGADETVIYFDEKASDAYDVNYDAVKMMATQPGLPNIYSRIGETELSINALGEKDGDKVVPLELSLTQSGLHTLQVIELYNFAHTTGVFLEDRLEKKFHNIRDIQSFEINAPEGLIKNRYFIHFSNEQSLSALAPSDEAGLRIYPNPAGDMVSVSFSGRFNPQSCKSSTSPENSSAPKPQPPSA
jgi:trimeric autotransporter adhesin